MSKIREIIRIAGTDLDGRKKIPSALTDIKGVSFTLARAISAQLDEDSEKKIGELSKKKINKIEKILENPKKYGIKEFMLNRRKDPKTGRDRHLVSGDLEIQLKQDIDRMKKLGSYRGMRHRKGLPVRGQKTKSSFRGKKSIGVERKKVKEEK